MMLRLSLGLCFLCVSVTAQTPMVTYKVLSTLFLPYTYTPDPQFAIQNDAAEQMSFDASEKILYSVGATNVHVIDLTDVANPTVLHRVSYTDCDVTDVEVCGNYVFVSFDNETKREDGFVNVYRKYNRVNNTLDLVHSIVVGTIPDMVAPTSDCSKVLVAIEGEIYVFNNTLIDNPGGIGVLKFPNGADGTFTFDVVKFDAFNAQFDQLKQSGVRHTFKNSTFADDIEPEYIAYNKDQSTAYISLQENNAIAVFDIAAETITGIFGMGFKDWSKYTMDASDKDSGINMAIWPVFGMYQPDSLKVIKFHGVDYIITADEGDSKDYDELFSEEVRVKDLTLSSAFGDADRIDDLQKDSALGRLKVTNIDGLNAATNTYDQLYTFGGRGFSIRRADTMELVYDSGDEMERQTVQLADHIFNNAADAPEVITTTFDGRSDDKGPETESLAIGNFDNFTLIAVGNERPGTIAIYSIDNRQSTLSPVFVTLISQIPRSAAGTWEDLYSSRTVSMLDPEDLSFVPASSSPNGKALLLASGSTSGTITVIEIDVSEGVDDQSGRNGASDRRWPTGLFLVVLLLISTFAGDI